MPATCGFDRTKLPHIWKWRCRRPLSQPAIALVERRTEGWIAGVQLASLSLRDAEDPEGLLVDLSGRWMPASPSIWRTMCWHTNRRRSCRSCCSLRFWNSFCVALCEAVISSDDPEWTVRRCIDWVERHNLFISSLDNHKEWYDYHQMFRSVLLQRAKAELGPDRIAEPAAQGGRLVREPWPGGRSRALRPGSRRS